MLWFFIEVDSFKNIEFDCDLCVILFFKQGDYGGYFKFDGMVIQVIDKVVIYCLWSLKLCVWFIEGEDDLCIGLLCIDFIGGEYWDNCYGVVVIGIKLLFGVFIVQCVDEGVYGKLMF